MLSFIESPSQISAVFALLSQQLSNLFWQVTYFFSRFKIKDQ